MQACQLPLEVWMRVLGSASPAAPADTTACLLYQRLLARVSCVSRSWRRAIIGSPDLWRQAACCSAPGRACSAAWVLPFAQHLTHLHLDFKEAQDLGGMLQLLAAAQALTHLTVTHLDTRAAADVLSTALKCGSGQLVHFCCSGNMRPWTLPGTLRSMDFRGSAQCSWDTHINFRSAVVFVCSQVISRHCNVFIATLALLLTSLR